MTKIIDAIKEIRSEIPNDVELVAVSKFHPAEAILEAYSTGQRVFGENRPQEMTAKSEALPKDIKWHMIGHLQTNKVKMIAPYVSMIESVDTAKLLQEINKQAYAFNRVIPCLLEIHVAKEETKSGFTPDECRAFLEAGEWKSMKNVQISGIMCMASYTADEERIKNDFRTAYNLYKEFKELYFCNCESFRYRSWGMTHDYKIAINEGANIIRIGTQIFGERTY